MWGSHYLPINDLPPPIADLDDIDGKMTFGTFRPPDGGSPGSHLPVSFGTYPATESGFTTTMTPVLRHLFLTISPKIEQKMIELPARRTRTYASPSAWRMPSSSSRKKAMRLELLEPRRKLPTSRCVPAGQFHRLVPSTARTRHQATSRR